MEITQFQTIEKIVDIPETQTLEAVLHELELGCYDLKEISYTACLDRKRIWRRVWHSSPTPTDASKSERSWRRLSKRLCYEEGFEEMKRTCAHCGMFVDDDDDILVPCQGPECRLRIYGICGVFHRRCAVALGYSGSARWQNCPWCSPTVITASNVECLSLVPEVSCAASASWVEYISWLDTGPAPDDYSMTRSQEVNYAALTIQRRWRWMHKKRKLLAASEEKLKKKLREVQRHLVERLPAGVSAKKTKGLKEIQSALMNAEIEWRELFNEDLKTLETEYICRLRRVVW